MYVARHAVPLTKPIFSNELAANPESYEGSASPTLNISRGVQQCSFGTGLRGTALENANDVTGPWVTTRRDATTWRTSEQLLAPRGKRKAAAAVDVRKYIVYIRIFPPVADGWLGDC